MMRYKCSISCETPRYGKQISCYSISFEIMFRRDVEDEDVLMKHTFALKKNQMKLFNSSKQKKRFKQTFNGFTNVILNNSMKQGRKGKIQSNSDITSISELVNFVRYNYFS